MSVEAKRIEDFVSEEKLSGLMDYLFTDCALDDEQRQALRYEAQCWKQDLLDQAAIFEETDQLSSYIALKFMELKARWIVLNARIQDANRMLVSPDPQLMYRSSALSGILGMLEGGIDPARLQVINDSLAQQASSLEAGPYVLIEGDQIIIEGKQKVMIYKKGSGASDH